MLTREDGIPRDWAVNLDPVQAVSKNRIGSLITALSPARVKELRLALLFALGF
jgi:mRNA interferase MazF